jgi:hypothetical protein
MHFIVSPCLVLFSSCLFFLSSFQYLTPRIRIFPRDLTDTPLFRPTALHFICSPSRAAVIMSQVAEVEGWSPVSIYEPVPVRTVPSDHNHTTIIPHPLTTPHRCAAPCRCLQVFRIVAFRKSFPHSATFCHTSLC